MCTSPNIAAHSRAKKMRPVAMRKRPLMAKNGRPRKTIVCRVVFVLPAIFSRRSSAVADGDSLKPALSNGNEKDGESGEVKEGEELEPVVCGEERKEVVCGMAII